MSRRPRRLPLNDRRWLPLTTAYPWIYRSTGDGQLAARDLNAALASERMRSMRRRRDGGGPDELLSSSFWAEHGIGGLNEHFLVMPRGNRTAEISSVFYVWEPDFQKIFGHVTTLAGPRKPQEVPVKRGKKPVHDRADLQAAALGLALQRKQGAPEKKRTDVVDELREWCKRNKRKVPADSTLYEIVAAAFRIKLTLKS